LWAQLKKSAAFLIFSSFEPNICIVFANSKLPYIDDISGIVLIFSSLCLQHFFFNPFYCQFLQFLSIVFKEKEDYSQYEE